MITQNGMGDSVVMDIEASARREAMLRLRETLAAAEGDRLAGEKCFSVVEIDKILKESIQEIADARRN